MSENRHDLQSTGDIALSDKLLRNKTQDELINEMADKWDAMSEDDFDSSALDAYLDALEERAPLTIDTEASLTKFREKHARLIQDAAPVVLPNVRPRNRNTKSLRVFRLIAAILAVMIACAMTAQALGVDVFGAIARWTGQMFHFSTPAQAEDDPMDEPAFNSEYSDIQDALQACGVTGMIKSNWNPLDFKQTDVKVVPSRDSIKIHAIYQNGNKKITFSIWKYESMEDVNNGSFEKDEQNITIYEVSEIEHYIMSNNDQISIAWVKDNMMCSLSGDIESFEHAKTIINSIYER